VNWKVTTIYEKEKRGRHPKGGVWQLTKGDLKKPKTPEAKKKVNTNEGRKGMLPPRKGGRKEPIALGRQWSANPLFNTKRAWGIRTQRGGPPTKPAECGRSQGVRLGRTR